MRVKRGKVKKRRHKKVLKQAKGYRLTYSKLYRRAREALMHAGDYSFAHRKKRQNQFRKIWIKRINAVCKQNGTSYSRFINNLKQNDIILDRKIMSYLIENHKPAFEQIVKDVS
jgi:large subunit ribosomal protein L20